MSAALHLDGTHEQQGTNTLMPILTSIEPIRAQLAEAFAAIEGDPLIVHSDLVRIGFAPRNRSLDQQLADWVAMILEASQGRTLLFPTFNYDFARTGVFRPATDPGQVGALNEHVRRLAPDERTRTPIFNFAILNRKGFPLDPSTHAFDDDSTFGRLRQVGGGVVFLGAGPEANTFIHHVEEASAIPYRYLKPFRGVIEVEGEVRPITLFYRVRPAIAGVVDYDWQRLADDLRVRGILRASPLGNARIEFYRAPELYDYWCRRLRDDVHFLLTPASRLRLAEMYARHGKPLTYDSVEGAQPAAP
jgi:aminoglycoside N3'-acetyltransferase